MCDEFSTLFDLFVRTCPSKTDFVVISFHLEMVYFATSLVKYDLFFGYQSYSQALLVPKRDL